MTQGTKRRLVLIPKGSVRPWRVGDHVKVRLGSNLLEALVIEDRGALGPLGPTGAQVVRVEVESKDKGMEGETFEVPAAAILRLKAPGTGHGRSADLDVARQQALANARTWVLREFDAQNSLKTEQGYSNPAEVEDALEKRGLNPAQRQALYRGEEVVLGA